MTPAPLVTLLSDFGTADGYLGAMKGAVLSACPGARLVDLGHGIAAGDVRAACRALAQAAPLFPAGTVHLAVVDPGVGTERRGLAAEVGGRFYVAPDNGLLGGVLGSGAGARVHVLAEPALWRPDPSPVFHGRDVFGPVAGALAAGVELASVGPEVSAGSAVRLPEPAPRVFADRIEGEVVAVDGFGNLVTNLAAARAASGARVEIAGLSLPLSRTYGDVAPGEPVALAGSGGTIEVARNRGSAAESLGAGIGRVVVLRALRGEPV